MGRLIDIAADCRAEIMPTTATPEALRDQKSSCINNGAESIPSVRNEEGEATTMSHMSHGSRKHRGNKVVVDSGLLKVWCHLKARFRTLKIPDQRRQASNDRHPGSIDLDIISENRKFIVEFANSDGWKSETKVNGALSTEDLAALNKLHSNLIPATYRATRDMSQLIDSSWWSE